MGNILMKHAQTILPIIAEAHEAVAFALADQEKNLYKYEHHFFGSWIG